MIFSNVTFKGITIDKYQLFLVKSCLGYERVPYDHKSTLMKKSIHDLENKGLVITLRNYFYTLTDLGVAFMEAYNE